MRTGLATVMLALLALYGCGSSHAPSVASTSKPPQAPAAQPGLGATRASFDAAHGSSADALKPETTYALIVTNAAGRVISYEATFPSAMSDIERVNLLGGTALPSGAVVVQETPVCKLWRSATLRRLIGFEFARVTTVRETASANIRATDIPSC
jgi:hypothetical protein